MVRRMVLTTALLLSTWTVAHPTVAAAADRNDARYGYTTNYRDTRNFRDVRVRDSREERERLERQRQDRERREREARERFHHQNFRGYDAWRR